MRKEVESVIAIRTMLEKMPQSCDECKYINRMNLFYCVAVHPFEVRWVYNPKDGRTSFCPLVEVEDGQPV